MTWTDAECDAYVDALPPYSLDYEVDPNASIRAELTAADKIIRARISDDRDAMVDVIATHSIYWEHSGWYVCRKCGRLSGNESEHVADAVISLLRGES